MPDPHGGPGCPVSPEGPHLLCPPPSSGGGGVAIPSGMVHVTPCRVTWCGGDQHQVLDHTIEAMVAKEEMNLLFLQSEGPEKVALKEDSQMEEGTLVGVLLEPDTAAWQGSCGCQLPGIGFSTGRHSIPHLSEAPGKFPKVPGRGRGK